MMQNMNAGMHGRGGAASLGAQSGWEAVVWIDFPLIKSPFFLCVQVDTCVLSELENTQLWFLHFQS